MLRPPGRLLRPSLRPTGVATTTARWHTDPAYRARSKFYSSKRWQDTRAAVLRANPLCAWCLMEGRVEPATEVDHIADLIDGGAPTDYANLRALSKSCHARLTQMKQRHEALPNIPACKPPSFTVA
jgi:5-methylcytosine-specific restriction protein A